MNTQSISKVEPSRRAVSKTAKPAEISAAAPSTPAPSAEQPDALAARRAARKPFGALIQRLSYPPREGYHRHWFNDHPGNIDSAIAAGYEHVIGEDGKKVCRVADRTTGMLTYNMEIPKEWFQEDMVRGQNIVDERESAMRGGVDAKGEPGKDGRYIPSRGIKIETNKKE